MEASNSALDIPLIFAVYEIPAENSLSGERELGITVDVMLPDEESGLLELYEETLIQLFARAGFWTDSASDSEYPINGRTGTSEYTLWQAYEGVPKSFSKLTADITVEEVREALVSLNDPMLRFNTELQDSVDAIASK